MLTVLQSTCSHVAGGLWQRRWSECSRSSDLLHMTGVAQEGAEAAWVPLHCLSRGGFRNLDLHCGDRRWLRGVELHSTQVMTRMNSI